MAQSIQRKLKRGILKTIPNMFSQNGIMFLRKLSRGGYATTRVPGSHNGPVFGQTYSRKQVKLLNGEE